MSLQIGLRYSTWHLYNPTHGACIVRCIVFVQRGEKGAAGRHKKKECAASGTFSIQKNKNLKLPQKLSYILTVTLFVLVVIVNSFISVSLLRSKEMVLSSPGANS